VARGANVTPGYLDEPGETAAILHDGWLWTGDLARRDEDGFLFHQGRSKEIIKVKGHRVSPAEIEFVLAGHPDLAEVAVVGSKHDLWGEVPVAFVVPRPGTDPTEGHLRAWCRERLPIFKVPNRFTTLAALPRNPAGKLLRAELSALADAR
jgi:acyl-CoA synthetase (AMP-forming)/AMP-acid ligase II